MKSRLSCENDLKDLVENLQLHKKSLYTKINAADIADFPKMDRLCIVKNITLGSYQLKQSLSYLAEHLNQNGKYEILVAKENLKVKDLRILQACIQSRHANSSKYRVYVKYIPNSSNEIDAIKGWYCSCKNGSRTVGCCSYVASIIYYLADGKYKESLPNPAGALSILFSSRYSNSIEENDENEDKKEHGLR